jgi:hypothetical protein
LTGWPRSPRRRRTIFLCDTIQLRRLGSRPALPEERRVPHGGVLAGGTQDRLAGSPCVSSSPPSIAPMMTRPAAVPQRVFTSPPDGRRRFRLLEGPDRLAQIRFARRWAAVPSPFDYAGSVLLGIPPARNREAAASSRISSAGPWPFPRAALVLFTSYALPQVPRSWPRSAAPGASPCCGRARTTGPPAGQVQGTQPACSWPDSFWEGWTRRVRRWSC